MNEPNREAAEALKKLRGLLKTAGFTHFPSVGGRRSMNFNGQYREWMLHAFMNEAWFHVYTFVCNLPPEPGLRSELLLWLMRANAKQSLLKYSVTPNDHIVLEFEVRAESVTAEDVYNLVWHLQSTAERDYLTLQRVASGEARLDALASTFGDGATLNEGPK